MVENKFERIRSALAEAEASLKLARQLLLEAEKGPVANAKPQEAKKEEKGIVGTFDGEQMITEIGEKHPVPANYASKSLLVVGDTLKLIEEGGEKRFKQIEHVKRHKTVGILAKKDGKWHAVTPEGSYRVLPAAVEHFGGEVGEEVSLYLPANNLVSSFGAIEAVNKKVEEKEEEEIQVEVKKPEAVPEKAEVKVEMEKKVEPVKEPTPEIQKEKSPAPKIEKKPVEKKPLKQPEKVQEKEKPAVVAPAPAPKPTPKPIVADEDELA